MTCLQTLLTLTTFFNFTEYFSQPRVICVCRPQESEVVHLLAVKCEMGVMELYFEALSHWHQAPGSQRTGAGIPGRSPVTTMEKFKLSNDG